MANGVLRTTRFARCCAPRAAARRRLTVNFVEVDLSSPTSVATTPAPLDATSVPLSSANGAADGPAAAGTLTPTGGAASSSLNLQQLGEEGASGAAAAAGGGGGLQGQATLALAGADVGDDINARRAYKLRFQEGVALFNKKPKKGEGA